MNTQEFYESFESISQFPGIKANSTVFAWHDTQGSAKGTKALGFRCGCPNAEADELGLNKDGWSGRGVPPCLRPVDNAKRRGLKALPKSRKRLSVRF